MDGNITVAGVIIYPGYDGTIAFNDKTITITGDFIKKDGTLNAGTSKVIFAGTGEQKVEFSSSETFYNLEITNSTGGTVTFNDSFTANEFKINPGNYLKFMAGETFAITTLTGSGTDADSIYLLSTSAYDVWNLNLTNSATLSYLTVARCNASGGAYLAAGNSTDLGGNTNCILHDVEITSVLNRYHAEGSAGDATIEYKITGTDGFVADQVVLTITRDGEENPFYTKTEPGNKPIGSYSIIWPANADAGGPGINDQVAEKSPFTAKVEIFKECKGVSHDTGDAENEKIYVIKVEILSPAEGGKLVLSDASKIVATGQILPSDTEKKLHWETTIEGTKYEAESFHYINPQLVNIEVTSFPNQNSSWGDNTLKAIFLNTSISDTHNVKYFYLAFGTQKSPKNWYYYYKQTSANYGTHQYDANLSDPVFGQTRWDAPSESWKAYIGKDDLHSTSRYGGVSGIDHFANTCRHEAQHVSDGTSWWPNGYDSGQDADGDWVPDNLEASLGYDNTKLDSDGDGDRDCEDHAYDNQPSWTKGSADSVDWANPGHQYP